MHKIHEHPHTIIEYELSSKVSIDNKGTTEYWNEHISLNSLLIAEHIS